MISSERFYCCSQDFPANRKPDKLFIKTNKYQEYRLTATDFPALIQRVPVYQAIYPVIWGKFQKGLYLNRKLFILTLINP
jgi:hypothetical protein